MNDLFNFLKNLIRDETDVIAAFLMGIIVATGFLTYLIYWLFGKYYKKKIAELENDLKKATDAQASTHAQLAESQHSEQELKKKAKDRKTAISEQEAEITELQAKLEEAMRNAGEHRKQLGEKDARYLERLTKYNEVVRKHNNLVENAKTLKKQLNSLNEQAKLFEKLQGQLWDLPVEEAKVPPFRKLARNRALIIAVINLKGGVGKTTLTANVGITYRRHLEKRVLLVDLDFQASLTNLCLPAEMVTELKLGTGKLIDNLFRESVKDLGKLAFDNIAPTPEPKLHLLAASGDLAGLEEQSKARWLTNHAASDIRCVLRSAFHDPLFQENFDIILIDCPPRWTTSSINAIACCDYVLIPTQLDRVSSEAVPRLLAWLRDLRATSHTLYGNFDVFGVVGNLSYRGEKLIAREKEIWEALPGKCKGAWFAPVNLFGTIIKDKSEIRRAANNREFAALYPTLQPTFVNLVQEIEARRSAHERS